MTPRKSIIPGTILILIGLLALLQSLGLPWLRMEALWPVILILAGALALVTGLRQTPRVPDNVWFGCVTIMCGGLFLYITLGAGSWSDMNWLWPAFPLIGGVSWLIAWLVDMRQVSNLTGALVAGAVGIIGFLFTYRVLDKTRGQQVASFWPLILVILGIGLIVQYWLKRD